MKTTSDKMIEIIEFEAVPCGHSRQATESEG